MTTTATPRTADPAPAPSAGLDPTKTMVGAARGPGLWIAPAGTPGPADIDEPFGTPWVPVGYLSPDGVTFSSSTTSESFTPWQSRSPIRTEITERTETLGFVMWELNADSLALYFNNDVTETGNGYTIVGRTDAPAKLYSVAVDVHDADNKFRKGYYRATLESVGDMVIQRGAMVPLEVTMTALDNDGELFWLQIEAGGSGGASLDVAATAVANTATATASAPADAQATDAAAPGNTADTTTTP